MRNAGDVVTSSGESNEHTRELMGRTQCMHSGHTMGIITVGDCDEQSLQAGYTGTDHLGSNPSSNTRADWLCVCGQARCHPCGFVCSSGG